MLFCMKRTFFLMSAFFAILFYNADVRACTGITLHAADGCHMVARTIEWGNSALKSDYVVMPRGHRWQSFTPSGHNGAVVVAKYGLVGLGRSSGSFIVDAYPVSVHPEDVALIFATVLAVGFTAVWYPVRYFARRLL